MGLKRSLRKLVNAKPKEKTNAEVYNQDGLRSVHDHSFMEDPAFNAAYARGLKATKDQDYKWHWRVHIGLWAASSASRIEGDFVECGVNYGFLSSAIMQYLNWSKVGKTFYLLDTFAGLDERYVTDEEKKGGSLDLNKERVKGFYNTNIDVVKGNFSEWKNVKIIQGSVPDTLPEVKAEKIAYMHLDMNCAPPEVAAAKYFWPKIAPGGIILLDDYAFKGYTPQKDAMDDFARSVGIKVLSLPTGQGLFLKPTI